MTDWRFIYWLAFLAIKHFKKLKDVHCFFRHNAIACLGDYSTVLMHCLHALQNQKLMRLDLLQYLLPCGGLELNPLYLWVMPIMTRLLILALWMEERRSVRLRVCLSFRIEVEAGGQDFTLPILLISWSQRAHIPQSDRSVLLWPLPWPFSSHHSSQPVYWEAFNCKWEVRFTGEMEAEKSVGEIILKSEVWHQLSPPRAPVASSL